MNIKKLLFAAILLLVFGSIGFAQEEKEVEVKKEKKIMIKIMDEDGKITTKVLEGDDIDLSAKENIWISEKGDSIKVEIEIEEGDGNVIKKRIVIPDMKDFEGLEELKKLEGLEDLEKHIEIFDFEDEFDGEFPHMFFFGEGEHPHPMMKEDFFIYQDKGPRKGKLGVYIEEVEKGVKVTEVIENSSAYSVGILAGDVITKINDKKMTNVEELVREVGSHQPGDIIEIKLKRNGKTKKFNAKLQGESYPTRFKIRGDFPNEIGPKIQEGVKKFKHHFYRGLEDCQKKCQHKNSVECEKKCLEHHKTHMEKKAKDMELKLQMKMDEIEKED